MNDLETFVDGFKRAILTSGGSVTSTDERIKTNVAEHIWKKDFFVLLRGSFFAARCRNPETVYESFVREFSPLISSMLLQGVGNAPR